MNDVLVVVLGLVIAMGGLIAVATLLEKRSKKSGPNKLTLPEAGPTAKKYVWITRALVTLLVLSIVGVFVFRSIELAWFAGACMLIYFIAGTIARFTRLIGK